MEKPGIVFRREYERINADVYKGALPGFPGIDMVDRLDVFSMTRTWGAGPWRVLRPFLLSQHVTGKLLVESARHETAHAAALLFDDDEGHGEAWRRHAKLCGAKQVATLDDDDPLRTDWPKV